MTPFTILPKDASWLPTRDTASGWLEWQRPDEKAAEYIRTIEAMKWPALSKLLQAIRNSSAAEWDEGKALEHLVIRGFVLSGLEVEYPYDVPAGGRPLEQIDGLVILGCHMFLVECEDKEKVDIEPRFDWNSGEPRGLSDHLPILGQIALPTEVHRCPR